MLFKRVVVVLILLPLLLGALFSPWPFLFKGLILAAIAVSLGELATMAQFRDREKGALIGLGLLHALFLLFVSWTAELLFVETAALLILVFLFFLLFHAELVEAARRLALMVLGLAYLVPLLSMVGLLRDQGPWWVFLLFAMTWLNDTFAFFVGHRWGKRRLAPRVSPGKTVEGLLGGLLGSLAGFLLVWYWGEIPMTLPAGLVMVLLVGILAPMGDLAESLLKRGFGVKDSGHLIPGHGGLLDRVDALLFVAPVVYGVALFLE